LTRRTPDDAWIVPGVLMIARYPSRGNLERYHALGVRIVVNLHRQSHDPAVLAQLGLTEVHLPVRDFTPPATGQISQGVEAIRRARDADHAVLVHCTGGKGRSGTLAACYLVSEGMTAAVAIEQVRACRPGAVETRRQVAAVTSWAAQFARTDPD
jgi:atypical dual specificity phosphatase